MKKINKYYLYTIILMIFVSLSIISISIYKNAKIRYNNNIKSEFKLIVNSVPRIMKYTYVAPVYRAQPVYREPASPVLQTLVGNISHYGPDCAGCSGRTASGQNIANGNIYYNDQTYGEVHIVAGDPSLPFGSIVRLNVPENVKLAVVLDRGGGVGIGRRYLFDLLTNNESIALKYGVSKNISVDILRYGF